MYSSRMNDNANDRRKLSHMKSDLLDDRRKGERRMMNQLRLAIDIATAAHSEHKDKRGKPEVEHPLAVAAMCETEEEKVAAVLHDVVEDTKITLDDLRRAGIREDIVVAVDCLTHREGESTNDYLDRVASNKIARGVKDKDMTHNSSPERLDPKFFTEEQRTKTITKYETRRMILREKVEMLNKKKADETIKV